MGSQEIIPKSLRARKNLKLKLTQSEYDVLIGSILGDGYITKKGKIQIEQGEKQKQYVEWKYEKLINAKSGNIIKTTRKYKGKEFSSYRFWTRQFFSSWRKTFYPYDEKIIPRAKINFSPLLLAVWYMDDGYLRKENTIALSTDKFNRSELVYLTKELNIQHGLNVSIVKSKKLYFDTSSSIKFLNMVKPYIIPSMMYKISLTP
ncbi:MAG: hypothetical protein L6266_01275 [Nanoarchaeota archaeon]|nr:hypothetical protein [Nanoarchaeota archaeon]